MNASSFDQEMIQRCLTLAKTALGRTSPNPMVGALLIQDGEVVGEGYHPGAGQPHGEVMAIAAAGERARGATLYVNLEPCYHYGRTPPCTEAIMAAGIKKVVVGMVDVDPRTAGQGIAYLQSRAIEVVVGVEEEACRQLNEAFIYRVQHQRPFGILKYAMTLDGKIATTTGDSAWVTGEEARARVSAIRGASDAVIVGGNTVRRDNPRLTARGGDYHQPLRVVMSRSLDLPMKANLWHIEMAPTLVLTEVGVNPSRQEELRKKGVEVLELPLLTPATAIEVLYQRGLNQVLWECGGVLGARVIADGAAQKIMAFIAPKIIGGTHAPTPVGDLGFKQMNEALSLDRVTVSHLGVDLLLEGYL